MEDAHRTAIKKELRVLGGYLRVVEYWLDANCPGSAYAVMEQARPIISSLELALRSAASQDELNFGDKKNEVWEKSPAAGFRKRRVK